METREIEFKNRHGKRMPATLRMPQGEQKGIAVVLHGLAGWKDQSCVTAAARAFAESGYATLTFEASDGALAPDNNFSRATTTGYVEDLADVIKNARSEDWGKGALVLSGHSQGALVALRYARLNPEAVSRLVLFAPAISWRTDAHVGLITRLRLTKTSFKGKPSVTLYPRWIFDFLSYDALKDARTVTTPVLVVSAERDEFVAPTSVHKKLAETLSDGTHLVIKEAKHEFLGREEELTDTIKQWLTSS